MKRNLICLIIPLLTFFLLISSVSFADNIQIDEIIWQEDVTFDPLKLSATVDFTQVDADTFTMTLTNLTEDGIVGDYPATVMLTGMGFYLDGNTIKEGSVSSDNLFGSTDDPSKYWGYDNSITRGYFQDRDVHDDGVTTKTVSTVVSTMTAAVDSAFDPSITVGNPIAGPDWGVLSNNYGGTAAYPYFQPSVSIDITLTEGFGDWGEFISGINEGDVVVAFGSPTAPVPEPATMLLLGSGLIGLAGFSRRFRKK